MKLYKLKCEDSNGRKFGLIIELDHEPTQDDIDQQNVNRAKFGFGDRTSPIVSWELDETL